MIIDFYDKGTEDVYNGINSKQARKTLPVAFTAFVSFGLKKDQNELKS